ncbi:MerR family DNA-binding protein [Micromonospora zhanjiangensis]
MARLELIRTLRELGLGLADVRRVLARETTVAAVAAVHVTALDAQIRALRLRRAVLAGLARREPRPEETTRLNRLARLADVERRRIVEDFLDEVFDDLDADPTLRQRLRYPGTELPDEPAPEQVEAWLELAELARDPDFRQRMRAMIEHSAAGRAAGGPGGEPGAYRWFARKVAGLVGAARERGVAPTDPAAADLLDRLLGPVDRSAVLTRVEAGADPRIARYRELLAAVEGVPAPPSTTADHAWLAAALRAHPHPPNRLDPSPAAREDLRHGR